MRSVSQIIVLMLSLLFLGCNTPKIKYAEYKNTISETGRNQVLARLDANDSVYSILMFTEVFKNDMLKVQNGNSIIFHDTINSDPSLGLAKSLRINNQEDIEITDINLNYSFVLKKKKNIKFKYIYVNKKKYENNKYIITYSNDFRAFY